MNPTIIMEQAAGRRVFVAYDTEHQAEKMRAQLAKLGVDAFRGGKHLEVDGTMLGLGI